MDWKYMGSANAGRLIEAMKCITEAIGARTPEEQIELLDAAEEEVDKVIDELRKQVPSGK